MEAIGSFFKSIFYVPVYNLLVWFVSVFPGESLGLGIIALTVLVRLALLPSSAQAVRAQKELQVLQPEIDKLRKELKEKPEELNRRMLALYQEHNVNPFRSCLPLLIQLPILLILYQVFLNVQPIDTGILYGFVSAPEHIQTGFLGIDLAVPSILLAVVAGALQFLQARQLTTQRPTPTAADGEQDDATRVAQQLGSRMTYIMPVVTVFIAATLPAALALYWIVTTLFSVVQQWWILRTRPEVATPHVAVSIRRKS